ncbi:MAG TPA: protein kinase [Vicinamibacterales bacterium]
MTRESSRWNHVERLLHAALERRPEERDAFLREACSGDDDLVREVTSLLAAQDSTDSFLETPPLAVLGRIPSLLPAGGRVDIYEIVECVGVGGMGEVYKALDTKLGRSVAVKLISGDVVDDPGLRRRFEREARTASSLNHPHIVTVHDVGEFRGRQYIVTEFVDGGTLRAWAHERARSRHEILELMAGVADGLAVAHEAGILHRDIKPENILVSRGGYAKLTDFGLAKAIDDGPRGASADTLTVSATRPGSLVGTIAYMSPEQASGRRLDARSDVFSFGVVLYELVAGRRPFGGTTDLDTLHAIAHDAAPKLPADVLPDLRLVVEKALEKEPATRYQTMRELVGDLRRLARSPDESPAATSSRAFRWGKIAAPVAALLGLLVVARYVPRHSESATLPPRAEYTQLTNFTDSAVSPALSPDGRLLTFIRGESTFIGKGEVYVRALPDGEPTQLTRDGLPKISPAFAPDGSRVAYGAAFESADWNVWTVSVLGGQPQKLVTNAGALTWVPRAVPPRVLFSEYTGEGIRMAIATSTESRSAHRVVYSPPGIGNMVHRSALSPDGRWVLAVEMGGAWLPCRVVPFEVAGEVRPVGPSGAPCTDAAWTPDGEWMYLSANAGTGYHIWRQKFPDGVPEQVTTGATEEQGISFAPDGRSFVTSIGVEQNSIWIHDAKGDRQITSQGYAYQPKFSPDRKKLYYLMRSGVSARVWVSGALWVADLESGDRTRLLPDFVMQDYSISPDGTRVAFSAVEDAGAGAIWVAAVDGRTPPRPLEGVQSSRPVFGPDGYVYFVQGGFGQGGFLAKINPDGGQPERLRNDHLRLLYSISPDGRWAAAWTSGTGVGVYSLRDDRAVELCATCGTVGAELRGITPPVVHWLPDGRSVALHFAWTTGETIVMPFKSEETLRALAESGMSPDRVAALPGATRLPQRRTFVGSDPGTYVFMRNTTQRNIYSVRVP